MSKPPSRGPLPAPFGMCECLVMPSSLLVCTSPDHEVMWRVAMPILLSSKSAGFAGGSSYLGPCPPTPGCACDKPGSHSSSVSLLVLIPPENAGFMLSAPYHSIHDGHRNGEVADPACWGPLGRLCPNPEASLLWEERHNLQVPLLKKQGKKDH